MALPATALAEATSAGIHITGLPGCRTRVGFRSRMDFRFVGTINDFNLGTICGGNLALLQLDTFSWSSPTASHITKINCMPSFWLAGASKMLPAGWYGHLTSSDSVGNAGTWKSRVPFSKGGILYLPAERQISAGGASVHDATFIMSPDSGSIGVIHTLMQITPEAPVATAAIGPPMAMPPSVTPHRPARLARTRVILPPPTVRSCGKPCLTPRKTGTGSITDIKTAAQLLRVSTMDAIRQHTPVSCYPMGVWRERQTQVSWTVRRGHTTRAPR